MRLVFFCKFAKDWFIWVIICKRPAHPVDHLQKATKTTTTTTTSGVTGGRVTRVGRTEGGEEGKGEEKRRRRSRRRRKIVAEGRIFDDPAYKTNLFKKGRMDFENKINSLGLKSK